MIRDRGYKSGTVPEIPGQLEPMDTCKCYDSLYATILVSAVEEHLS